MKFVPLCELKQWSYRVETHVLLPRNPVCRGPADQSSPERTALFPDIQPFQPNFLCLYLPLCYLWFAASPPDLKPSFSTSKHLKPLTPPHIIKEEPKQNPASCPTLLNGKIGPDLNRCAEPPVNAMRSRTSIPDMRPSNPLATITAQISQWGSARIRTGKNQSRPDRVPSPCLTQLDGVS
jgi:hypothetical protein